jgi:SAM-dependent methyltransferase
LGFYTFLPKTRKALWQREVPSEIAFWDDYIRTKGKSYGDTMLADHYLNPDLPLQDDVAELLPGGEESYLLLDVGAGPFTFLGKRHERFQFKIIAVDPLADAYAQSMTKYSITPLVRTEKLEAECLTERFKENTFDLAFARNCLDHSYDPEKAIIQMLKVVKPNHYVLLKHIPNVAESERNWGLHQWNFREKSGDFIIASKWRSVNMTQKYKRICSIECLYDDQKWLITRIRKK